MNTVDQYTDLENYGTIFMQGATEPKPLDNTAFDFHYLDAFPGHVFYKNLQGCCLYVNPAVEQAYECSDDQFIGLTIEDTPASIFAELYAKADNLALSEGYYECLEPIMEMGKIQSAISKTIVIHNSDHQIIGLLTMMEPLPESTAISLKSIENIAEAPIDSFMSKAFFEGITTRESEVLYLMVRGQSANTIAQNLNLALRTVNSYIDNMKARLCVDSKQALIEKAFDMGFIYFTPERFRK